MATNPNQGVFVYRRVDALFQIAHVTAIQPQPYFPFVKPFRKQVSLGKGVVSIKSLRMPYLPKFGCRFNGSMLSRCVSRWISNRLLTGSRQYILDAHFGYPEGVGCYRVAKRFDLPVFITIRGLEQPLFGTPIGDQIIEALNGCTGVIAVSESLRDAAIQAGANAENITVIPNGMDHSVFHALSTRPDHTGTRIPQLVSVGNLKYIKGVDVLLRAFQQLLKTKKAHLVLIGDNDETKYASAMRDFVRRHKLDEFVTFTGSIPQTEVSDWLQRADLFVLASRREGCCNAILEALACGVPVGATDVGDNHRFVRPGVTGQLVAADSVDRLAVAMEQTLHKTFDKMQIAQTVESLSWDLTAKRVLDYFQERLDCWS